MDFLLNSYQFLNCHKAIQRKALKGVSLDILERVQNRTYVMSLIEKEKMIRQTEMLGNGFATAGMTIG